MKRETQIRCQEIIVPRIFDYLRNANKYSYMLNPFATGIGKTYMYRLICDFVCRMGLINLYLTPRKNLIDDMEAGLLECIRNGQICGEDGLPIKEDKLLVVRSNADSFASVLAEQINNGAGEELIDIIEDADVAEKAKKQLAKIDKAIADSKDPAIMKAGVPAMRDRYKKELKETIDREIGVFKEILADYLASISTQRRAEIEGEAANDGYIHHGAYLFTEEEFDALSEYYPAMKFPSAKIVIMNSYKALFNLDPFDPWSLLTPRDRLNKTVLNVDESDSLPLIMFQIRQESPVAIANTVEFVHTLFRSLSDRRVVGEDGVKYTYPKGYGEKELWDNLESLYEQICGTSAKYDLGWGESKPNIKFSDNGRPPILLQQADRIRVCHSGEQRKQMRRGRSSGDEGDNKGKGRALVLSKHSDDPAFINIQYGDWVNQDEKRLCMLQDLVSDLNGIIKRFFGVVRLASLNYVKYRKGGFLLNNAVRTCARDFGFRNQDDIAVIEGSMFAQHSSGATMQIDRHDPYAVGYNIMLINDSPQHDTETYIENHVITNLPEYLMRNVIDSCYAVLLVSATSAMKALWNFDFSSMNVMLAETHRDEDEYIEPCYLFPPEEINELNRLIKEDGEPPIIVRQGEPFAELIQGDLRFGLEEDYWKTFLNIPVNDKNLDYHKDRFAFLSQAIDLFIGDPDRRAGLVFLPLLVKASGTAKGDGTSEVFTMDRIKRLFGALYAQRFKKEAVKENYKGNGLLCGDVQLIFAGSDDYKTIVKALKKIKEGQKLLIITSRSSFDKGYNFEQLEADEQNVINKYNLDFIAVYDITHVLSGYSSEDGVNAIKRLMYADMKAQNMVLDMPCAPTVTTEDILNHIEQHIRKKSKGVMLDILARFPLSPYACQKTLEVTQALGRQGRGNEDRVRPMILYHRNLSNSIKREMFEGTVISKNLSYLLDDIEDAVAQSEINAIESLESDGLYEGFEEYRYVNRIAYSIKTKILSNIGRAKDAGKAVPELDIKQYDSLRRVMSTYGFDAGDMLTAEEKELFAKIFPCGDKSKDLRGHIFRNRRALSPSAMNEDISERRHMLLVSLVSKPEENRDYSLTEASKASYAQELMEIAKFYDDPILLDGGLRNGAFKILFDNEEEFVSKGCGLPLATVTEDTNKGYYGEVIWKEIAENARKFGSDLRVCELPREQFEDTDFAVKDKPAYIDVKKFRGEFSPYDNEYLIDKIRRMPAQNNILFFVNVQPVAGDIAPWDEREYEAGGKKCKVVLVHGLITMDMVRNGDVFAAKRSIEATLQTMKSYIAETEREATESDALL